MAMQPTYSWFSGSGGRASRPAGVTCAKDSLIAPDSRCRRFDNVRRCGAPGTVDVSSLPSSPTNTPFTASTELPESPWRVAGATSNVAPNGVVRMPPTGGWMLRDVCLCTGTMNRWRRRNCRFTAVGIFVMRMPRWIAVSSSRMWASSRSGLSRTSMESSTLRPADAWYTARTASFNTVSPAGEMWLPRSDSKSKVLCSRISFANDGHAAPQAR